MSWRDRTGVFKRTWERPDGMDVQPGKTIWDWLQLLIVPVILLVAVTSWNTAQTTRDKHRDEKGRQDTRLVAYFNQMSDLILKEQLLSAKKNQAVRSLA